MNILDLSYTKIILKSFPLTGF